MIKLPSQVEHIMNKLKEHGFESYVVGGCVRDSLLNIEPKDWDIATNAIPDQVISIFGKVIPTGIKHGTVTVMVDGIGFEVTTYRIDGEYEDSRHPKTVEFTNDITKDLSRRDLTINAMAYNYENGLIDIFDGQNDLQLRRISFVNGEECVKEDPLRMLRAIRFATQFKFYIEPNAFRNICENVTLINNISKERIQMELNKILVSDNVKFGINLLDQTGLLNQILYEVTQMKRTSQNNNYHIYNVFDHTVMATNCIDNKLHLRLATLLHDVGKPYTKTTDTDGVDHFYSHEVESARIARDILKSLKYDNCTIDKVCTLIKLHARRLECTNKAVKRFMNQLNGDQEMFMDWLRLRYADILAQNPKYLKERMEKIQEIEKLADYIISNKQPITRKDLNIDGFELQEIGFKGKEIGDQLNELLELVLDDPSLNRRYSLKLIAKQNYEFLKGCN